MSDKYTDHLDLYPRIELPKYCNLTNNRGDGVITTCDDCMDFGEEVKELKATTTHLRGLLRECARVIVLVDNLYPYAIPESEELIDELAKELADK